MNPTRLSERDSDAIVIGLKHKGWGVGDTLDEKSVSSHELRKTFPKSLFGRIELTSFKNIDFIVACQKWLAHLDKLGWATPSDTVDDVMPFAMVVFRALSGAEVK